MHGQNHIKYCRSLWLTAGTVGKVPKRRHVAKSCILIADRTQYSPCEEASTFSASQKNPPFYGTPKFITVFTPARHFSLSCAIFIQFAPSNHIFYHPNSVPCDGQAPVVKEVNNHPITDHELRCASTLSSPSSLNGVGGQRQAPAALYPGNRPGTHCTRGWVDSKAGLDWCGNSRPHRFSIPWPSRP